MKILIFFVFTITLIAANSNGAPVDALKSKIIEVKNQCVKEMNFSDDILAKIKNHEEIDSPEAKCFEACLLEKLGIMGADSKISSDKTFEIGKPVFGNDEKKLKDHVSKIKECTKNLDSNRCEAAHAYLNCIIKDLDAGIIEAVI